MKRIPGHRLVAGLRRSKVRALPSMIEDMGKRSVPPTSAKQKIYLITGA
jgi:hypothetical protein